MIKAMKGIVHRNPARFFLLLIVLLGALLRLHGLAERSLWFDECATVYLSGHGDRPVNLLDKHDNSEAPLLPLMVRYWYGAVLALTDIPVASWPSDFLLRLLPCLFSIAAIPLLYLVARRLIDDKTVALLAAFLLAISPFQIYYAQELRVYSVLVVLGLISVYSLIRATEEQHYGWFLAVTLSFSLLFYSHFNNVWNIFTFNLYVLCILPTRPGLFWRWTGCQLLTIVLIIPGLLMAYWINQILIGMDISWYPKPTIKTGLITFKDFFAGYAFRPAAYWTLMLLALSLTGLGIASLWRRWKTALLLALLIAAPIAENVVFWRMRDFCFYEHRLFILSGAVASIAIAQGMRSLRRPAFTATAALVFAALTVPCLADHYGHRIHPIATHRQGVFEKVDFRTAAAYIRDHWQEGDLLTYSSLFNVHSMKHYCPVPQCFLGGSDFDGEIYDRYMGASEQLRRHGVFPILVETATRDAKRVWYIEAFGMTYDDQPQSIPPYDWLDEHFRKAGQEVFDGVRVTLFERVPPA